MTVIKTSTLPRRGGHYKDVALKIKSLADPAKVGADQALAITFEEVGLQPTMLASDSIRPHLKKLGLQFMISLKNRVIYIRK